MTDFDHLDERLAVLRQTQRWRSLVARTGDGVYVSDAQGRSLLNFGGNDYLGLAGHPIRSDNARGSGASPLVSGWTEAHRQLADALAAFESTESCLLFATGYAACSGTIATLAERGDLILSDQLNHASLIDGCRLSRAERIVYPHRDCESVEATLRERRDQFARVWILTDGVFSMDGHLAPLPDLCSIAERYGACMIVDEAHGTGVLGTSGAGVCEALGVKDRVPIRIGTLSKATGGQGGFVAAPRVVTDYLTNHCRSLIYSTALSPVAVATAARGLEVIRNQPQRRADLHRLSHRAHSQLSPHVDPIEASVPIIPVVLGSDQKVLEVSKRLADAGIYVPAIRPPTVPEGSARLRVTLSAAHDREMVEKLLETLAEAL